MFKNKPLAALVALACTQAAMAATPVVQGEAVVVTATRSAIPVSKVLSDITVIGREEIEQTGSLSLPELLSRQAGVEFYSNGGEGKSSSLMLRGATAKQTLVLIDGMRIVSATAGTTSLENIPLGAVERIEILRGPASSLYGADAIGGVIQIFTKRGEGAPVLSFNAGIGAEGKTVAGAGIAGKVDNTAFSLAVDHNKTSGISAKNAKAGAFNPDRDGYENTTFLANVQHEFAAGHSIGLNIYQTNAMNEYDQSVKAQDKSESIVAGQSIELKNRLSSIWNSTLRYSNTTDKADNFTNGQFSRPSSTYETKQSEWQWQNDVQLGRVGQVSLGAANVEQDVTSTTAYTKKNRTIESVFAAYQGEFGAHSVQASARHDDNSQFGGKSTGQIGYGFVPAKGWLIRAAYGTAFKAPTFNDLYWPLAFGYQGNPNLKPETAQNREVALQWREGGSHVSLTAFDNRIENLIVGTADWSTVANLDRAKITGQTLDAATNWGNFSLSGNITSQRAKDQSTGKTLQYRAELYGSMTAALQLDRTRLSAELRASGKRPTTLANTEYMGGYGVLNLGADYQLDKSWVINTKLTNVADKEYATTKGYNTYRRGWFVGVRYAQ